MKYHPVGSKKPKPVQVDASASNRTGVSSETNAIDDVWTKKVQYMALLIIVGLVIIGFLVACGVNWVYNSYYDTDSAPRTTTIYEEVTYTEYVDSGEYYPSSSSEFVNEDVSTSTLAATATVASNEHYYESSVEKLESSVEL